MAKKKIQFEIPDYLTIDQYLKLIESKNESNAVKLAKTVAILSGKPYEEVRYYDIESIIEVSKLYLELADYKESFFPLIEWKGQIWGFASMKKASLGEFIDLENLCQDMNANMHKIASIIYRPVTKSRFKEIVWSIKQSIKVSKNNVSNPFDWYEIEKYDSEKSKDRHDMFKEFPAHLFLGAISFFLSIGSLYLNRTAFSKTKDQTEMKMIADLEKKMLESLSQSTGDGSVPFTNSQRPILHSLQETSQ